MKTPAKPRFESFSVLGVAFLVIVTVVPSLTEGTLTQQDTFGVNDEQSYYFYQQSEYPRDCLEALGQCSSSNSSGVYAIKPDGYSEVFDVYCDSEGYTLLERRTDGLTHFNRSWGDYESGFGFLSQEFWLGNQKLSYLTNQKIYQLRIDVTLNDGSSFYDTYDEFRISDAFSNYELINIGQHDGIIVSCPSSMLPGDCTCHRPCADPDTCTASVCHVTGSCVCPDGFFVEDGFCVPRNQCGCFTADADGGQGTILKDGGIYVSPNCSRRCSCTSGHLNCEEIQCSPHGTCGQSNNSWTCSCTSGYEGDGVQCTPITTATDCNDVFEGGLTSSGMYYIITVGSQDPFQVYCNMSDGGGWTVLQRQDGSDDFYRSWEEYKNGFGSLDRGMWLGNDKIYQLTNQKDYELRIDLTYRDGHRRYATYSSFRINDESDNYRIASVGPYGGTTGGDRFSWNAGKPFSTRDRDNDGWSRFNCAEEHQGGWWFGEYFSRDSSYIGYCRGHDHYCEGFPVGSGCAGCTWSFLNANYHSTTRGKNIFWADDGGEYDCNVQYTEIRPA